MAKILLQRWRWFLFAALCSVKKLTSQAPYQPSAVATLASDMASQRPTPDAQHDGDIGDERLGDCTDSSPHSYG